MILLFCAELKLVENCRDDVIIITAQYKMRDNQQRRRRATNANGRAAFTELTASAAGGCFRGHESFAASRDRFSVRRQDACRRGGTSALYNVGIGTVPLHCGDATRRRLVGETAAEYVSCHATSCIIQRAKSYLHLTRDNNIWPRTKNA